MKTTIIDSKITIEFESKEEKEAFLDSEVFKDLMKWESFKIKINIPDDKKDIDWEKILKKFKPWTYPYIPPYIEDPKYPPEEDSPRIDDPVRFPSTAPDSLPSWTTITTRNTDDIEIIGGADATPRYGKATVDWPSKYPCEAGPLVRKKSKRK